MCNIKLKDHLLCDDAEGGYSDGVAKTVYVIDASHVEVIPAATGYVISEALTLKADTRTQAEIDAAPTEVVPAVFSRLQLRKEGLQYNGTPEGNVEDGNKNHVLAGRIPKMSAGKSETIDSMGGGAETIVIFTDGNGKNWLMGDAKEGCATSSTNTTDGNGYNISINWLKGRSLYEYTGAIPTNG